MLIRKVEEKDIPQIEEIEKENFLVPYKISDFEYELNDNPYSHFLCLSEGDEICAYIIFWITFDSSTLCRIATKNSKKRLGFARLLLENMEKICKENEVSFLTLEVRVSNTRAINLYKKFGYETVTIKSKYYENSEDALYMMKGI